MSCSSSAVTYILWYADDIVAEDSQTCINKITTVTEYKQNKKYANNDNISGQSLSKC